MNISYTHESIRLTGRWDKRDPRAAVTTTTGAYVEFAFEGRMAVAQFDSFANAAPHLHLWVQLDGGAMIETPIDNHLRIVAKEDGNHVCRIIYKGGMENSRRWYAPLTGMVAFVGVQTEKPGVLPADNRPVVEFVGDSITEGVLIDMDFEYEGEVLSYEGQTHRVFQDDVCATYAWQTAEALNLRPVFMGYGAVGVTRAGQGLVPAAPESYPFNFDGSPITHAPSDYVVINHGANDRRKDPTLYLKKYTELLDVVRSHNPNATVVVLSAFCGAFHEELGELVARYNKEHGCNVHYIDSNGWIPEEPLHPLRDGHSAVAAQLIPRLGRIIEG